MKNVLFMHKGGELMRGSEISLLLLLKNLDRTKIHPIVLCNTETFAKNVKKLGLEVYTMRWPEITIDSKVTIQPFLFVKSLFFVNKIIKNNKVDLLYSNGGLPCQISVILSKIKNLKTICHIRSPHPKRYAWMWLFKFSDSVIFVSEEVRKAMLSKASINRTCVVYNAVDTKKFKQSPTRNSLFKRKLSIENSDIVVGQVGSLIPRKGLDVLLKAFASLNQDFSGIKLVLVGGGDDGYCRYLKTLAAELNISDQVIFAGETTKPELFYTEVFDINVLASRMEALPRTLIEASACGLPSVASNCDGIPEVVEDGVTGLLFERENFTDLKEKLAVLVANEALRHAMGRKGRERVVSIFNVKSYVNGVQDEIFNTLAPTRGKARLAFSRPTPE